MATQEQKRALIIAQEAARAAAEGKTVPPPKGRANWAASPAVRPRAPWRGKPKPQTPR
jgi:hypothetical protein